MVLNDLRIVLVAHETRVYLTFFTRSVRPTLCAAVCVPAFSMDTVHRDPE
jgi:hypothetical protein